MKQIKNTHYEGERPLFASHGLYLEEVTIHAGESALKECSDIEAVNCRFEGKYPFWHNDGFVVKNCLFTEGARAALWYSRNLKMKDTLVEAPKMFREMDGVELENVQLPNALETLWYCRNVEVKHSTMFEMARAGIWYTDHISMEDITYQAPKGFRRCKDVVLKDINFPNAAETLWNCSQVKMQNVTAKGDYFAMGSSDMEIDNFTLVGNYSFDGAKNLTIRNARMLSKDAFWNCENVTVYDSFISGEYLGWNAKNVTLINCTIESEQGMCYMDNLKMENCRLLNTNLAFEYATVDAQIDSKIDSVKNPISGKIRAKQIDEIIFDNPDVKKENTDIVTED